MFLTVLASTALISLISLVGIVTLFIREELVDKSVLYLVSLAAGALIGGAFLHLLPESVGEAGNVSSVYASALGGFIIFFLVEKALHWRHCHDKNCEVHTFAYTSLLGEVVHNFIDGLVIAASFAASPGLGWVAVIAVALHEVPQEIGDFGVLVYAGFSKKKSLMLNFASALTVVLGGFLGWQFLKISGSFTPLLVSFAAGGFVYVGASDLLPEVREEKSVVKSLGVILSFLAGILLLSLVKQ